MVDLDRPRLQRDALAVARQIIGALALDLDGGVLRRDLLDQAGEPRQQVQDPVRGGPDIAGLGEPALGVVCFSFLASSDRKSIAVPAVYFERSRLGILTQAHWQLS